MAEDKEFSRKIDRKPWNKYYAAPVSMTGGESMKETLKPYKEFRSREMMLKACFAQARGYVETVMNRLAEADPEFSINNEVSQRELEQDIIHNMC